MYQCQNIPTLWSERVRVSYFYLGVSLRYEMDYKKRGLQHQYMKRQNFNDLKVGRLYTGIITLNALLMLHRKNFGPLVEQLEEMNQNSEYFQNHKFPK